MQLCNDKCAVLLGEGKLLAVKDANIKILELTVVLEGKRSKSGDRLLDIPLLQKPKPMIPSATPNSMNVIIWKDKSKHDLIVYLHAVRFSPSSITFIKAIKKNFLVT